jgi:hypothetical protein
MWFCKKAAKADFLECVGCGCSMRQARKEVEVECSGISGDIGGSFVIYGSPQRSVEFYCGRCAPPYDMRRREGSVTRFYRSEPAQNVEITEKGKPVQARG